MSMYVWSETATKHTQNITKKEKPNGKDEEVSG